MHLRFIFTLFLACSALMVKGQSNTEDILFTLDGAPVYASEFTRVYKKNLDLVQDETQKDVDEYLKLFTNYKLKLAEARHLELHEKSTYKRELSSYKKQLSKNYMTDSKVTDALVNEAYNRMVYEVDANHILVKIDAQANPQDSLVAYNKISALRERALQEGFEKVRAEVHNGQTVFGEKLGYFGGFKMVYKFENAAFNTPVGKISQPFRTRFGFHIVNVLDKRKSRGERTVAHIMVIENKTDSLAEKPEVRIQDIYKKLNQGEAFEALAKQFSDDKNSAPKGGKLKPFSSGQIRSKEFEDIAFNLSNIGAISKPFKTDFGWHIVKLHDITEVPSFEAMEPELVEKVKRDTRSQLIDDALTNKLKEKYNISASQPNLEYFESILNDDYFRRTWTLPQDFQGKQPLVKIGNKQFSFNDFAVHLMNTQRNASKKEPIADLLSKKYDAFLKASLMQYQEDNLEQENEEFAHVVSEYRDGLLLFDLMETTIWNTAKTDSLGIKAFFESHKSKYKKPKRVDAVVASSAKSKTLKKVAKLLSKNMPLDQIKSLVNSKDNLGVIFTSAIMDQTHQALPKGFKFTKGISKIKKHNDAFVVVQVKEVLPEEQKTFEEAKGSVISDYQNNKEANWLKGLSAKYKIVVNQEVLDKVKSQLKN